MEMTVERVPPTDVEVIHAQIIVGLSEPLFDWMP